MRRFPRRGGDPSTVTRPLAAGSRPRASWNSVVLPAPFGPITPTTAPVRTLNVPCDQTVRPPRTTLTSVSSSAGVPSTSAVTSSWPSRTQCLRELVELTDLPRHEGTARIRRRFRDLDHRDPGAFCGLAQLLRQRAAGLGVVDEHVHAAVGQRGL